MSGLTEMDAITLSTARLSLIDPLVFAQAWRLLVAAVMANMFSKTLLAGLLGGWRLVIKMALLFAVPMAGGAAMLAWGREFRPEERASATSRVLLRVALFVATNMLRTARGTLAARKKRTRSRFPSLYFTSSNFTGRFSSAANIAASNTRCV